FSDDDQGTDIGAWRFSETLSEIVEFHPEKATQVYPLFVEEWQRDLWFSKVTEAGSENPGALKAYGRPDFINQALEFAHARPAGYPRAQALTQLAQLILLFSREAKDGKG
ncbi:MAG: hypothetical protein O2857_28170, partial [Planctomycetota bacterium]|nr:hypothetical protein [Planctomycetota bacterium]